ncbi:50S ribosomal protein L32 [Meiothermus granaticius]|uniref:Large ribosomal subunit protein bL32 n=1 Tax=Meiothermus granaticius NBRC 107808 TaxID=1227551 RepID=A0A399FD21_9DEIN|nr:50S ribosomal protein L32 [Meiothermus granaticius]MCL6527588.1 50S ribosomal protein L32 [Thermaceae bacterium]RIH93645.1 50S ribosomal protein L32 [Meiothermus granaticius NBRC 107808]GEM86807.1 50S ribosomal protein L32 [Meiothermus granaticius NBRC 107808]
MAKHPVPKKKVSKSRRDIRRAAVSTLTAPTLIKCANCGAQIPPHTVCPSCGYYGGKQILEIEA